LGNTLATWAHDHPDAAFDAREALVLEQGRALLRHLLGLVAGAAGLLLVQACAEVLGVVSPGWCAALAW
jgi:hypothetical protein